MNLNGCINRRSHRKQIKQSHQADAAPVLPAKEHQALQTHHHHVHYRASLQLDSSDELHIRNQQQDMIHLSPMKPVMHYERNYYNASTASSPSSALSNYDDQDNSDSMKPPANFMDHHQRDQDDSSRDHRYNHFFGRPSPSNDASRGKGGGECRDKKLQVHQMQQPVRRHGQAGQPGLRRGSYARVFNASGEQRRLLLMRKVSAQSNKNISNAMLISAASSHGYM
jgi:hypothetical protein